MTARVLAFVVPIKTTNPLNGSGGTTRGARMAAARRGKQHREAARLCTLEALRLGLLPVLPLTVTLTRLSAGTLDAFDGLPASLKRVVDGICDALGVDDGDAEKIRFVARQEKCAPKTFGVRVEISKGGEE